MAPHKGPLQPEDLPNPFAYERKSAGCSSSSLRSCLWEVLKHQKQGLSLPDCVEQLKQLEEYEGGSHIDAAAVHATLEKDPYFYATSSAELWSLTVYQPLRWGVAGVGLIAHDFVSMLTLLPGAELMAVASGRDEAKARNFAKDHGAQKWYGDYNKLASDPEVDVVYIATIHPTHPELCLMMLEQNKAVICEKPIAVNAKETRKIIAVAQEKNLFLTEGLWTRFFPAMQRVKTLINEGAIGQVQLVQAAMGVKMTEETERLYNVEMGGGGLLDIGVYPLQLASWAFGCKAPASIACLGALHEKGADTSGIVSLRYGDRGLASLAYSIRIDTPIEATIYGTDGRITVHHRLQCPTKISVCKEAGPSEAQEIVFEPPPKPDTIDHGEADGGFFFGGSVGFIYEAMAVHSAVRSGLLEMEDITHEETVIMMETCDALRAQLGVAYPQDSLVQKVAAGASIF